MTVENIFSQIKETKEKNQLIETVFQSQIDLSATSSDSDQKTFTLKALSHKNNQLLCRPSTKSQLDKQDRIIIKFLIGPNMYITLSKFSQKDEDLLLLFDADFFKMERRADFRIELPPNNKAHLLITKINNTPLQHQVAIADFSAGGCKIIYSPSNISIMEKDRLEVEINLEHRIPMKLTAEIKHVDKVGNTAGLQFLNLDDSTKIRLMGCAIDLHALITK